MSKSHIEFSRFLFEYYNDSSWGPFCNYGLLENDLMIEIVSRFLSKIFKDVESFKMGNEVINIEKTCNGKCKFLGDVFAVENSEQLGFHYVCRHGLYNQTWIPGWSKWPFRAVKPVMRTCFDFNVEFHDDMFIITETYGDKKEIKSLMEPKYQKRYVELMSKRFGHEYKKHYRALAKEKEAVKEKELSL